MIADPMTMVPLTPALGDGMRSRAGRRDALGAFLRKRLRLQHEIRALKEAHEQGLALDMSFAAQNMEAAARELASHLRQLLAYKARMDARGRNRALIRRKEYVEARVQGAMYECRVLREMTADLFEACLCPDATQPSAPWPGGRSPAESYPWLRRSLEGYATMIDCILTIPDGHSIGSSPEEQHG